MNDNRTDNVVAAAAVNLVTAYVTKKGEDLTPGDIRNLIVDVITGIREAAARPLELPQTAAPEKLPETQETTAPVVAEIEQGAPAVEQAKPETTEETSDIAPATPAAADASSDPAPAKTSIKTPAKSPKAAAPKTVEQSVVSEASPPSTAEVTENEAATSVEKDKTSSKRRSTKSSAPKAEPIKPVKMTKAQAKEFAKQATEQPEATTKAELDKKFGRLVDVARIPFEGLTAEETLTKQPGYILSLFDGSARKMISRYLKSEYGMTENEYRLWWGLAPDYPMTSPDYAGEKSDYAKEIGLGTSAFIARARAKKGENPAEVEAAAPAQAAQEAVTEQPTPKSERVVRSRPKEKTAQKKASRATA